jgi:hypothetical protein
MLLQNHAGDKISSQICVLDEDEFLSLPGVEIEAAANQQQQAASKQQPAFTLKTRFTEQAFDGSVRHP